MRATILTAVAQAGEARGARARTAAVLLAAALAAACGSTPGKPPRPTTVTPDRGPSTVPVAVRIGGDGFGTKVSADFSGGGGDVVDARFQALLGATALEDVALRPDGTLDATVPAGLPVGVHDLTVIDPSGRAGTLAQAYRVLADGTSAVAVAGFRVDPVGPQAAFAPFAVAVTAVDETGAVVTDFTGEATLSDGTGAVVPSSLGFFVDGQWLGTVEVRAAHPADLLTVAEAGGATGTSGVFEVAPPPAASVRFDGPAPTVQAGGCAGPVRLTLGDAFGGPTVAGAPVRLTVAGSAGAGFTAYTDAGCTAAGAPTVPAGQGSASFWFVATRAGPVQLDVSGPSLAGDTVTATVAAGPPAALAFVTPPLSAAAGACAGLLTIEVRDAFGNPSPAGLAAVALAAAPEAGVTFLDGACATAVTSVAVPSGATTADLSLRATAAGAIRITASSPGVAPAVQDEVIQAGAATALAFATAARSAAAGACSAAVVVEARDEFGNAAAAARALRLAVSATPSAAFALYADAGCTTAADPAIAAGRSAATLYYRGTAAGDVVLDAAAPSLAGASQTERVEPGAPAALRFATAPQTVEVQACSAAASLELLDAFGNVAPALAPVSAALGAAPAGMSFFADAACAVPAPAATVPTGASATTFHFRSAAVGGFSVTAAAAGLAPASQGETVVAAGAARLAFATAPLAATAGTCSGPLTVESRDTYGNPVALSDTSATAVSLSVTAGSLHRNGGCGGAPLSSVNLAAGATSASVYLRGTVAGPATVTASATGVASASQTETILPAAAVALAVVTAPQTVAAGSCSGAVTVEARDSYGNAAPLSATDPIPVALAAPGLTLYADAVCAGPAVSSVTVPASATAASFRFRGTAPGAVSVTASASGAGSVSQPETIVAAAASELVFTTAAQAVTAGLCSGVVTVEARDAYGNPAVVSGTAATPVSLSSGLTLYAGAGCAGAAVTAVSLAAGATSASLSFRGTVAGPAALAATVGSWTPALQAETIGAAGASQLAFTTAAQTVTAGVCSGVVTVEARDAYGNPAVVSGTAATPVSLSSGLTLYAGAGCAGGPVTAVSLAAGSTTASLFFRGTAAGPATIAATVAAWTPVSQGETIAAAAASQLAFTTAAQTVTAGVCSGAVTVEARDAFGNVTAISDVLPTAIGLSAGALTLHADAACATAPVTTATVAAGATTASFHFRGTAAGAATIAATGPSWTPVSQGETIVAAAASQLAFATAPRTVTAGACSGQVSVEARDVYGNPTAISGAVATAVALDGPGLTLYAGAGAGCAGGGVTSVSLPAGVTSASFWFRGTAAGAATVGASASGVTPASQVETIVAAAASQLVFTTAAQTVPAGACSGEVTVEAQDAYGNPAVVSGTVATPVSLSSGLTLYAGAGCAGGSVTAVSLAAGATTASLSFRGTAAGPAAIAATVASWTPVSQGETIVAAGASQLAFTTAAQTVTAGSCSGTVTVEARDAYGNPAIVSGALATPVSLSSGLTLYAGAGCAGGAVTAVSLAAGATTASLSFRGTAAGAATIAATVAAWTPVSQGETIVAAGASQLAFTTAAQTVTAGVCSGVVTVEARDAYGNPAPVSGTVATPVSLSSGLTLYAGAGCAGGPVTAVSLAAGSTTASLSFRGTAAGPATIAATVASWTPVSQGETIGAAAASQLAFTTAAQTVTAGSCSGTVTIEARDAFGNATAISDVLPTAIGLSAATLTLHDDDVCATGPVTTATLAAGTTTVSFHFRGTAAGPATIAATGPSWTPVSQGETVVAAAASQLAFTTAPRTATAGACSGAVTIESSDPWGNPAAVPAATPVTLASGLTLHAGPGCAGPAVGVVTLEPSAATTTFSFVGFTAGTAAVTATATGLTGAGQLETVVAAPASRLRFLTAAQTVVAGACSGEVTLESRDAWDNPSIVSSTAATQVTLSAASLTYFTAADCGSGGIVSAALAAGATTTTFHLRGIVAGAVRLTASAGGLGSTFQDETVTAGPAEAFAWSAIASPQQDGVEFAVTVTAVDAHGNAAAYAGTAILSASPGTVACASPCTSAAETSAFTAGQWSGRVTVPAPAKDVRLTATGAGLTGTSGAFDVGGPASRSPPFASFTASARVVTSGGTLSFDASASSDYQTPLSSLTVSWDFEARDADYASTVAPPSAPWTAWSSAKTATHAYLNNTGAPIVYRPRLAVRDDEAGPGGPDIGYATGVVIVLPNASNVCVVDTDSLNDDSGSTSCDVKGPDGVTSLPEALRAANASASVLNVVFSGTRNVVSAGGTTLSVTRPVRIVANPGAVVLDGVSLSIGATGVLVSGLELARLPAPLTVTAGGDALLEDLHVHDGRGIEVQGRARIVRARMSGCTGTACVRANGAGAYLATFFSDLRGAGGDVGISLDACAAALPDASGSSPYLAFSNGWGATGAAFVGGTVLSGFGTGVEFGPAASCAYPLVTNVTFDRNGTGVRAPSVAGYVLDSVFTRQTASAVDAADCAGLALNVRNLTWENASDGCASSGAQLVQADPLYVFPGARDYRLQFASPAKDAANAGNNVEVDDAGPGLFLGAAPDRGGRETY